MSNKKKTVEKSVPIPVAVVESETPKETVCSPCRGTGLKDGSPDAAEVCNICNGNGIGSEVSDAA